MRSQRRLRVYTSAAVLPRASSRMIRSVSARFLRPPLVELGGVVAEASSVDEGLYTPRLKSAVVYEVYCAAVIPNAASASCSLLGAISCADRESRVVGLPLDDEKS